MQLQELVLLYKHAPNHQRTEYEQDIILHPQVKSFVSRIIPKYLQVEDEEELTQLATIGVLRALRAYDPSKNKAVFTTYATSSVHGFIKNWLRDHGSAIRQPAWYRDFLIKRSKTIQKLKDILQREPTTEEVAKVMSITINELERITNDITKMAIVTDSLDSLTEDGAKYEIGYNNPHLWGNLYGTGVEMESEAMQTYRTLLEQRKTGTTTYGFAKQYKISVLKSKELVAALDNDLSMVK